MGDVAMTVPVIHAVATQHPDTDVTVLTRKRFVPMFDGLPTNVSVCGIDLNDFHGISGLNRLYRQLRAEAFDGVADLHDVLRTKYLRLRFRIAGTRVAVIDKGRKAKHALIGHGRDAQPLRPMFQRYADVFAQLALPVELRPLPTVDHAEPLPAPLLDVLGRPSPKQPWVGIAPFAAHAGKIYPTAQMQKVAEALAARGCQVFLFGAGNSERATLESWEQSGIVSTCGRLGGLRAEMQLMRRLKAMIAMDSANMHIAALMGVPVISVWGATHPKAGFTPWQQPSDRIVQIDDLDCRPCSIYGNRPCKWGDLRCMTRIAPSDIVDRTMRLLDEQR